MSIDYGEFGDIISVYTCPECDADLRVEYRDGMPAHMLGLACPNGHVGLPVRIRDAARLDETFETRRVPRCFECQEQIIGTDPVETDEGRTLHPGECLEDHRRDMERLEALGGEN